MVPTAARAAAATVAKAASAVSAVVNSVIAANSAVNAAVLVNAVSSATVVNSAADRGERRPFVAGERREFNGERRGFGDRRKSFGGGQRRREDFGVRSGPRARALETRRFSERSDFAKNAVVKLDADIADYFKSAEDVNKALRLVIELGRLAKKPEVKTEAEKVEQAEAPAVAAEEAMFTEDVFEDEDVEAVAEAEETAEAKSEDKAE